MSERIWNKSGGMDFETYKDRIETGLGMYGIPLPEDGELRKFYKEDRTVGYVRDWFHQGAAYQAYLEGGW